MVVNHAVQTDKLDEITNAFCQHIAMIPLDTLTAARVRAGHTLQGFRYDNIDRPAQRPSLCLD